MKEAVNLLQGMNICLQEVIILIRPNSMIENMEVLHMEPTALTLPQVQEFLVMEVMVAYPLMISMTTLTLGNMDLAGMEGGIGRVFPLSAVMGGETLAVKVDPLATIQALLLVEVLGIKSLLVGFHLGSLLKTCANTLETLGVFWMFSFRR
jgi:hypothetical protein